MQGRFLRGRISPPDSVEIKASNTKVVFYLFSGTGQLRLRGALHADLCADVISQCRVRVLLQHTHYVWMWGRWEKKAEKDSKH